MKNKSIIIILIIIIIAVFGAFSFNTIYNHENKVNVGDTLFSLPEGFKEISSESNKVTIKNDTSSIAIENYNDNNITKYITEYQTQKKNHDPITTSEFSMGDVTIYKSVITNNPRYVHYWFVENDKVYTIYTWEGNNDTDSIVVELVTNMESIK